MNEEGGLHAIVENPHTWVYAGFFLFVILVGPKLWRALAQMLDRRALKIKSDLDEAQKLNFEVEPVLGEALQKIVTKVLGTPKKVADRARPILQE